MYLVRHAGGGQIGDRQAAEIARRAGGNPFFIIETTGMLMTPGNSRAITERTVLPPTVKAVVGARLDALPPRLREVARYASVFMYSFDLTQITALDSSVLVSELEQLEEAEVLVRDDMGMNPSWRVRHATLKDVAYGSLPPAEI